MYLVIVINLTTTGIDLTVDTTIATLPEVAVVSMKDFEEQCKQPIAITTTAVTMMFMGVVNAISMYAFFLKLEKMYNPSRIAADLRRKTFMNRIFPQK